LTAHGHSKLGLLAVIRPLQWVQWPLLLAAGT